MNDSTRNKVNNLISALDNADIDKEVGKVVIADPIEQIKQSLLQFFTNRLEKIEENDDFKQLVENKIREKIESDVLSVPQLFQIYEQISADNVVATNSLLSLFRPSKEGASPLLDKKESSDDTDVDKAFKSLNTNQLQKIDTFFRLMEKYIEDKDQDNLDSTQKP